MNAQAPRIQDQALLVSVNISMWSGTKLDREISKTLASSHGSDEKHLRANKTLIDSEPLKEMRKLSGQVRNGIVAKLTLPWNEGERLVTTDVIDVFEDEMNGAIKEMERLKEEFRKDWHHAIARAQVVLGTAFSEDDYPEVDDVIEKIQMTYSFKPLPSGDNVRVPLSQQKLDLIRSDIERDVSNRVNEAAQSIHERVTETVGHLAERLEAYGEVQDGDKVRKVSPFRDSTVDNVRELVEILPALNVTGDPRLSRAAEAMKERLANLNAGALRASPTYRQRVARDAKGIVEDLGGFMG